MRLEMKRSERVEQWLRDNLTEAGELFTAVEGLAHDVLDKPVVLEEADDHLMVPFEHGFSFAAACALEGKPGVFAQWAHMADYLFLFVGTEDEVLVGLERVKADLDG